MTKVCQAVNIFRNIVVIGLHYTAVIHLALISAMYSGFTCRGTWSSPMAALANTFNHYIIVEAVISVCTCEAGQFPSPQGSVSLGLRLLSPVALIFVCLVSSLLLQSFPLQGLLSPTFTLVLLWFLPACKSPFQRMFLGPFFLVSADAVHCFCSEFLLISWFWGNILSSVLYSTVYS